MMENKVTVKDLKDRVDMIYFILDESMDTIDYEDLLVETGKMLADGEFLLSRKKAEYLSRLLKEKPSMSANEQKVLVESGCAEVARVVRKIEQLNRALSLFIANKRS